MKLKLFLSTLWHCKILKWHEWTSKAQKGIKPAVPFKNSMEVDFWEYAKMYCDRCGHVSKISQKLIDDAKVRN